MYHCHFEDVEHVQMGMTGMVFVRPKQNNAPVNGDPAGTKYAYNDGDGSTQLQPGVRLHDHRAVVGGPLPRRPHPGERLDRLRPELLAAQRPRYPDTVAPNGNPLSTAAGRLQYQPISSLVTCNTGDRVLLRLSNLGYQNHAMTVDNIDLQIVAKDASLLKGRDGTTNYITTNTVDVGPGESRDVIFVAPESG